MIYELTGDDVFIAAEHFYCLKPLRVEAVTRTPVHSVWSLWERESRKL